jgi:DNA-binding SARP family transcriptional activator/pimeloyl-ACP methyl ester carboxylesterase/class 3 adenylate cyclase
LAYERHAGAWSRRNKVPRSWGAGLEFSVLGPVEVTVSGRSLAVGGARARAVLAMLLAQANHVVSADRLAGELWPGHPADRAMASLQVRLSELRKAFRSAGAAECLATRPPGYLLTVPPAALDSLRFARLAAEGSAALAAGDPAAAARQLTGALALWRGTAFAGIDVPSVRAEAARLEEMRLAVLESRAEALLEGGRHGEVIAELETLTAANPLAERLWSLRMLALYRAGRQADALRAYGDLRAVLAGELGIDPGPALRDLHTRIVRQDPALDGPGQREAGGTVAAVPQTRYARAADGVHIAYQVLGHGDRDIVFVPGLMSHLELLWESTETGEFFQRLATLGRLILFDKRDTGMSDRAPGSSTLEERMDDVRAVMDAAGSGRAALFGYSEGAPMSILFAATYPGRVSSLILGSAAARWFPAPGYPCGEGSEEMYRALSDIAENRWGQGDTIDWYLPSRAGSPQVRQVIARFERMAISPSAFQRMLAMIRDIDVRDVLLAIHVPTLVIQHLGDRINAPCHGRYLAAHIAGARYFEQPGDHSLRFADSGDSDALFREIADFLGGAARPGQPDRVLATILLAHAADSPAAGGAAPRRSPGWPTGREAAAGSLVREYRGRLINGTDQAIAATFDAPGQAIRCAAAIRDDAAARGIQLACGIHTGEIDLAGDTIAGASVDIATSVAALARPAEILVSRTVKDLLTGSPIGFAARGSQQLTGATGRWPLFAVTRLRAEGPQAQDAPVSP